ncbi:MAG: BatD family protein, partial [Balneolaceae bacterium]
MTRIGRSLNTGYIFLLFLFALIIPIELSAQDFSIDATVSENKVFIGEQFTLTIEIKGSSVRNVEMPVLPEFSGVRLLSSTPSRGTSISMINGRTSTAITYTYSFIAREKGNYTIPSITIPVDGEMHKTSPIQIEVLEKSNLSTDANRRLPDIFMEIEVNDKRPVRGQQLIASLVLYFKQGIEVTSYQPNPGWRTDGFWKEELENVEQPRAESEILNGVRYRKAVLMRYALFPTRSGELQLNPFSFNLGIRSRPERNDPFGSLFSGFGTNQRRISIETETVHINVRDIPDIENAVNIGAVGNFNFNRELNGREFTVGETIELTTRVEGTGNIPLISRPVYQLPDGFDIYSPDESSDVQRRGNTIRGVKSFTELIVARTAGTFQIPESTIAYYNPDSRRIVRKTLPAIDFTVKRPAVDGQIMVASDRFSLQPITGLAVWQQQSDSLYKSAWFWILILFPVLTLAVSAYRKKLNDKLRTDSGFARAHRSLDKANQLISEARKQVNSE